MFLSKLSLNDETRSGANRGRGRPGTELLHQREKIGHAPVLGDFAVAYAHDIDGLELNGAAGRRHAQKFSPMRAVISLVGRHAVAIGQLPMNVGVKIRERCPEDFVKLPCAVLVRCAARLRRMIEEVVCEQRLEHCEIPAALHFLGVASNDSLCGFAQLIAVHDVPPLDLRIRFGCCVAAGYAPAPAFWPRSWSSQASAMPVPPPCSKKTPAIAAACS